MNELEENNGTHLIKAFELADNILMKKYISDLTSYDIVPVSDELNKKRVSSITRFFRIERIVYDKDENILDKLSSVYNALSESCGSLVILLNSNGKEIEFYVGTKAKESSIPVSQLILNKSLNGNFPGSELKLLKNESVEKVIEGIFKSEYESTGKSIAAISGISNIRSSFNQQGEQAFIQGFEKLIDSMRGAAYSLIIIADPVSREQIETIRSGYESLYSQLLPFASNEINYSANESRAVTDSITKGFSKSINENLSRTQSYTEGHGTNYSTSKSSNWSFNLGGFMPPVIFGGGYSKGKTNTSGISQNYSRSDASGLSSGYAETSTEQNSTGNTITSGSSSSIQIKLENRTVKTLLERIDVQLKRLSSSEDIGMWNCSAYAIADDVLTTKIVASAYQSLMRGENSSVEAAAINTWQDKTKIAAVTAYLQKLHHPLINLNRGDTNLPFITPTSLLSGRELTIQAGLPQKSIPGLAVVEYASFGREVISDNKEKYDMIPLGKIYHMGKEESLDVNLTVQDLTSHTFITGSTGSGKSNTIYGMLSSLRRKNVSFLVIEPAKGEYKHFLGNRKDVSVYGTNNAVTQLLRINPFRFPKGIHVLEHIDRLIEIFNVCWPMYAAMPAVLKEAVEVAYVESGWDLDLSVNQFDENLFPTFSDILTELDLVITRSAYSEEVKSNYRGALFTRIKSLTNGLNGRIFCSDEIEDTLLFDNNAIIDLSRVGSMETKAMIMGILVMRLQEYRISQGGMNLPLKHITVLEEAHNLLKRTSTEQVSESSNLLGKSVEMLANAIAEMRTYGEGFIVADQAPGLLDVSVIRNTKTKIIFGLPEISDQELVGRAASLNESQIRELSKLKTGVAAIYQNGWLLPVLCKTEKFEAKEFVYQLPTEKAIEASDRTINNLIRFLLKDHLNENFKYEPTELRKQILSAKIDVSLKIRLLEHLCKNSPVDFARASEIINKMFDLSALMRKGSLSGNFSEWNFSILSGMNNIKELEPIYKNAVLQCLLSEQAQRDTEMQKFYFGWVDYMKETGI